MSRVTASSSAWRAATSGSTAGGAVVLGAAPPLPRRKASGGGKQAGEVGGASVAMIGVAGKDCHGPVELLGEHHPGDLMRPRHFAESEAQARLFEERRAVAVGAADGEDERRRALVAPFGDAPGEGGAGQVAAAFVERDEDGAGRDGLEEGGGFFVLARLGASRRGFREIRGWRR